MRRWMVILVVLAGMAQAQGVAILEWTQSSFGIAVKATLAYDLPLGPFTVSPYLQFGSGPPQWFGQIGLDLVGESYAMGIALHSQWGWLYRLRWITRF